jgi:transposase
MRPFGSPQLLEKRRRKAMELLDSGMGLREVARKMGCHASAVMRWRDARDRDGEAGLCARPAPGRPPKLTDAQKRRLVRVLLRGAIANGYHTELWTTARIAEMINRTFGVRYHRDHIGRLMTVLGWSYQKPRKRAWEHNDAAIEQWKREEWPRIKKTLRGWAPILCSSTSPAFS